MHVHVYSGLYTVYMYMYMHNVCCLLLPQEVPAAIGSLQQLENLNLDENSLSSLPPELGAVRKMNLLSVRANSLREMPSEVGELKDLSMLNVIGNR